MAQLIWQQSRTAAGDIVEQLVYREEGRYSDLVEEVVFEQSDSVTDWLPLYSDAIAPLAQLVISPQGEPHVLVGESGIRHLQRTDRGWVDHGPIISNIVREA